jgi:hypothetical protein
MYPTTWNDSWFQVHKATKDWYSEFDNWFIEGAAGTKANAIWHDGVNHVKNSLTSFLRYDAETNQPDGLQVYSKKYLIGDIKTYY